jgi:hypothetical protein
VSDSKRDTQSDAELVAIARALVGRLHVRLVDGAYMMPDGQVAGLIVALTELAARLALRSDALHWVYLLGGGDTYMEEFGRLCFCPLHAGAGHHSSACDEVNARVLAVRSEVAS